jgi:predicted outer membrane repeat protein
LFQDNNSFSGAFYAEYSFVTMNKNSFFKNTKQSTDEKESAGIYTEHCNVKSTCNTFKDSQGGGAYFDHSNIETESDSFTANSKPGGWGGAIALDGSTLSMKGGVFTENSAEYGGAIFSEDSNTSVKGGVFSGNTATVSFCHIIM